MAARSAGKSLVISLGRAPLEAQMQRNCHAKLEGMQRNCHVKLAARSAGNVWWKSLAARALGGTNATKLKREIDAGARSTGPNILVYLKCPSRENFRLHILQGAFIF